MCAHLPRCSGCVSGASISPHSPSPKSLRICFSVASHGMPGFEQEPVLFLGPWHPCSELLRTYEANLCQLILTFMRLMRESLGTSFEVTSKIGPEFTVLYVCAMLLISLSWPKQRCETSANWVADLEP